MVDDLGRIQPGERHSPITEFKEGEHWRDEKLFWRKSWLIQEYVIKKRSCGDIAEDFDCLPKTIRYHLKKNMGSRGELLKRQER